jgi:hypothetical protein
MWLRLYEPGESVPPSPGLLKKGGKDEEGLRDIPIVWILEPFA